MSKKSHFEQYYESKLTAAEEKIKIDLWMRKAKKYYFNVVTMIDNYIEGICNYFSNQTTSEVMKRINNKNKLIKHRVYGYINFSNFLMRLLV